MLKPTPPGDLLGVLSLLVECPGAVSRVALGRCVIMGCTGLLILQLGLMRVFAAASSPQPATEGGLPETSLCVVIPVTTRLEHRPCLAVFSEKSARRDWRVGGR